MSENFYDVLGVSRDASEEEIKQAYRKQAAKHHPDVSDEDDAEDRFKKIQKAKEVLTDEEKRRQYDQLGHDRYTEADKHGATGGGGRGGAGGPFGGGASGAGGFEDIFNQFFGGGGGPGGRRDSRPRQGSDIRTGLTIDLKEAFEGTTKQFTIERPTRCDTCGGEGHPPDADARPVRSVTGRDRSDRSNRRHSGGSSRRRPVQSVREPVRCTARCVPTAVATGWFARRQRCPSTSRPGSGRARAFAWSARGRLARTAAPTATS